MRDLALNLTYGAVSMVMLVIIMFCVMAIVIGIRNYKEKK